MQDLQNFVAKAKETTPETKLEPLPEMKTYQPFIYTASTQGIKDPFVPSAFTQQPAVFIEQPEVIDTGVRPDPNRIREELEKYTLTTLKMMGTLRMQDGNLWALIKAPDGVVHRVKEGNYLGNNHGKITAITEQRIQLIEIVNQNNHWIEHDTFLSIAE
ncbi:MAG: pilus assembly protein PilP [Candidatus Competibacteraceae bacterium]